MSAFAVIRLILQLAPALREAIVELIKAAR